MMRQALNMEPPMASRAMSLNVSVRTVYSLARAIIKASIVCLHLNQDQDRHDLNGHRL